MVEPAGEDALRGEAVDGRKGEGGGGEGVVEGDETTGGTEGGGGGAELEAMLPEVVVPVRPFTHHN